MAGTHERRFGQGRLLLERADITTLQVDAIVNAANEHLAGGGGVDGAIHRAAGHRELQDELQRRHPNGCPTGSAVLTGGHRLPARYVVHAVGPRWRDGAHGEPDKLRAAYRTAFSLAAEQGCASVAAPSISTGIYGFPVERAATIAVEEARAALVEEGSPLREIRFALFSDSDLATYAAALGRLAE